MRRALGLPYAIAFVAVAAAVLLVSAQWFDGSAPDSIASIDDFARELDALRVRERIPGMSAAIAEGDRMTWSRGFGLADVERGIPARADTIYHLASVTKPFAATVVLQLVDEGRVSLDAPLTDFGVTFDRPAPVRVWHLLSHTSGGTPGTSYRYDGDAFGRLDVVIQRATGHSLAHALAQRIIRPLALTRTAPNPRDPVRVRSLIVRMGELDAETLERARQTFVDSGLDRASIDRDLATGYARSWGRSLFPPGLFGAMRPMAHGTSLFAGAGLVSSAPDVARFSIALDEGRLLSAGTRERAWTPVVTADGRTLPYGLGWFVQQIDGERVVWHYGHFFESSALLVKIPHRKISFVVLANSDGLSRWRRLGSGNLMTSPAARLFLAYVHGRH
jgi:CubicO group peptidase (beta-lactamase class C family)